MRTLLTGVAALLLLVALAAAYLLLWPVPVQPVAWSAPPAPGYQGPHARNEKLARLQHLPLDGDVGPEHVVVREDRGQPWVYMAVATADGRRGRIVRVKPDGTDREVIFDSGGRPLGFDFDAEGRLIVADPMWGDHGALLRIKGQGAGAQVTPLVDSLAGDPITHLGLTEAAHIHAATRLCALADRHAAGRILGFGGGGYNRRNIARAWTGVVAAFVEAA